MGQANKEAATINKLVRPTNGLGPSTRSLNINYRRFRLDKNTLKIIRPIWLKLKCSSSFYFFFCFSCLFMYNMKLYPSLVVPCLSSIFPLIQLFTPTFSKLQFPSPYFLQIFPTLLKAYSLVLCPLLVLSLHFKYHFLVLIHFIFIIQLYDLTELTFLPSFPSLPFCSWIITLLLFAFVFLSFFNIQFSLRLILWFSFINYLTFYTSLTQA